MRVVALLAVSIEHFISTLGSWVRERAQDLGVFLMFLGEIFREMFRPPFRMGEIIKHAEFIGNQSFFIICLTGLSTGAVFALQMSGLFTIFNAESMVGGATALALTTELAPLIGGFVLAGRAGSSMCAEIATMVVREQIDAMEAMGVSPVHYLVVPRLLASLVMMPLLAGIFMVVGILGAYGVSIVLFDVDQGIYLEKLVSLVETKDIIKGLRKMFFFSFIITVVSCRFGLQAQKGAKGVGLATTNAVIVALLGILFADFIISFLQVRWLP
jgi:phospholipid/cholesterol/gamma-HCH transport system permease protein